MNALLQARQLECERGSRRLFTGLDLEVGPGECVHVAGENGAGKTSLLRILAGLLPPTGGTVLWRGREITRAREEFGAELLFVGHLNGVKDDMTALENICFEARMRGGPGSEDAGIDALAMLGMADFADVPARQLSQGQKRRVALSRLCGAGSARLWILDEPFNALDVRSIGALDALMQAHLAGGGSVVLTAHQQLPLPPGVRRLELTGAA